MANNFEYGKKLSETAESSHLSHKRTDIEVIKNDLKPPRKKIKFSRNMFIAVVTSLCILFSTPSVSAAFAGYATPANEQADSVTPTSTTSAGVSLNSSFIIKCSTYKSAQALRQNLTVSAGNDYTLTLSQPGEFSLSYAHPLPQGKIISFGLIDNGSSKSFAFETKKQFSVERTLPASYATVTPSNTGIEITTTITPAAGYEKYITIEPATKGSFSLSGNTIVFVPKSLNSGTNYLITVKKGLTDIAGDTLSADYTFTFTVGSSNSQDSSLNISGDSFETFLSTDNPVVELQARGAYAKELYNVDVLEVDNPDDFAKLVNETEDSITKFGNWNNKALFFNAGQKNIASFNTKLVNQTDYCTSYIVLPSKLPVGYYAVNIYATDGSGLKLQKLIQIQDYAVYTMSDNGSVLLWVNSTSNAGSSKGLNVKLGDSAVGKTDANGTLRFKVSGDKQNKSLSIGTSTDKPFITSLSVFPSANATSQDQFYSYIYTDRECYESSDTARVFGVLKPKNGASLPSQAQFYLLPNENCPYADNNLADYDLSSSLVSVPVNFSESGAFSAELKIDSLGANSYTIVLADADSVIATKSITVENYVKPLYKLDLDKQSAVFFGTEPISIKGTVSYYDGTPLANTAFKVTNGDTKSTTVRTDQSGRLNVKLTSKLYPYGNDNSWYPQYQSIDVTCANADDKTFSEQIDAAVLPRTVMLTGEIVKSSGGLALKINTNLITKNNVTVGNCWDDNTIRGAATDIPVTVKTIKCTLVKTATQQNYDYIEKRSYESYTYKEVDTTVSSSTVNTSNGVYLQNNLPAIGKDCYYKYELQCVDTNGDTVVTDIDNISDQIYLNYDDGTDGIDNYSFGDINNTTSSYGIGESAKIGVYKNDSSVTASSGSVLYAVMQNNINSYDVSSTLPFQVGFDKSCIPDVTLCGAYFDGKHIYRVNSYQLNFRYQDNSINIKTTSDKQSYKPGDTVNLDVKVSDNSGNPRSADINVSVVDEAAFAEYPQSADILGGLYQYNYNSGPKSSYCSYQEHFFGGSAKESGGGGGDAQGIRKDFADTAAFVVTKSDSNGIAHVSFKLPDNLTEWRVTTQAVTDDVKAGTNTMDVTTSLPFYADMVAGGSYLTTDDLSISARALGGSLLSGQTVNYTATLDNGNGNITTKAASALAGETVGINFGKQQAGTGTITLKAQCGSYTDTIQKTVSIVANHTELYVSKTFNLSDGINIDALKSPVTLVLFNKTGSLVNRALLNLCYNAGGRNDELIAKDYAAKLLASNSGDDYSGLITQYTAGDFQGTNGGARIYSYASEDPLLTARILATQPNALLQTSAKSYLTSIIDDSNKKSGEDVASAYFGLAALKEPVLNDIDSILKQPQKLDDKEKVLYACALAEAGDDDGAMSVYNKYLASKMVMQSDGSQMLKISSDPSVNDEYTSLMLYVLTRQDKELSASIMQHLLTSPSKTWSSALDEIYYIENTITQVDSSSVQYLQSGKTEKISIDKLGSKTLVMTIAQLKAADFKVLSGDVECEALYNGTDKDITTGSSTSTITKHIEKISGDSLGSNIQVGDDVKITVDIKLPSKAHFSGNLTDYIPDGMRFVSCDSNSKNSWMIRQEEQKLSFYINNNSGKVNDIKVVYYARAVISGSFAIDSSYLKSGNNKWASSEGSSVNIVE